MIEEHVELIPQARLFVNINVGDRCLASQQASQLIPERLIIIAPLEAFVLAEQDEPVTCGRPGRCLSVMLKVLLSQLICFYGLDRTWYPSKHCQKAYEADRCQFHFDQL